MMFLFRHLRIDYHFFAEKLLTVRESSLNGQSLDLFSTFSVENIIFQFVFATLTKH